MRIAQIATLYESVPPNGYGEIERVVSWLTEALVDRGHEVTLFASGDSVTRARLIAASPVALRCIEDTADPQAFHFAMLERVVRMSPTFDIVHFHTDYPSFPFAQARVRSFDDAASFDSRFTVERMADDYVSLYGNLLKDSATP